MLAEYNKHVHDRRREEEGQLGYHGLSAAGWDTAQMPTPVTATSVMGDTQGPVLHRPTPQPSTRASEMEASLYAEVKELRDQVSHLMERLSVDGSQTANAGQPAVEVPDDAAVDTVRHRSATLERQATNVPKTPPTYVENCTINLKFCLCT